MAAQSWNGDLRRVPFPEVLARLHREHASGTLYCVHNSTTRTVHIGDGMPYWSSSSDADDSARAWLFRRGHIAMCPAGSDGERQTAEYLANPELRELIESHAEELVLDLFAWGDGAFIFQPFEQPPPTLMQFTTSFEQLITQGLKRVRRLSAVRAGAGALDSLVVAASNLPMDEILSMEEDTCLILGEISSGAHGDLSVEGWPCDYRVLLCLWQLRLLDFVLPGEPPHGVPVGRLLRGAPTLNERTEEHARPHEFAQPVLLANGRDPGTRPAATPEATTPEATTPEATTPEATTPEATGPVATASTPTPAISAPRPAPSVSASRPVPSVTAPRPAPSVSAPRPVPSMTAPRPAPSVSSPRPAPPPAMPPIAARTADSAQNVASSPPPLPRRVPPPAPRPEPATVAAAPSAASVVKRARAPEPRAPQPTEPTPDGDMASIRSAMELAGPSAARVDDLNTTDLKGIGSAATSTSAADWFKTGERFVRELDLHNAITSFREAVTLEPGNADYRFRLGSLLARNPKWRKEAEEHLIRATEIKGWDARFQLALGKMYAEAGVPRKAEIRFKAALEADPMNQAALKELKKLGEKSAASGGGSGSLFDRLSKMGKGGQEARVGAGSDASSESGE